MLKISFTAMENEFLNNCNEWIPYLQPALIDVFAAAVF